MERPTLPEFPGPVAERPPEQSLFELRRLLELVEEVDALSDHTILDWVVEYKAILPLSGLAILNLLIYGLVFIPFANLLALYQRPRLNLFSLTQGEVQGLAQIILAFLALGLIYWQGWRITRSMQGKAAWVVVIGGSLISGILLSFMYPFDASDIFDNILRGRMLGVYAANPFLPATSQFATDPFYKYIAWKGWPSAYGPGWETMAALVARLAGNGVVANVLAFKILPSAFLLGSLGLVALVLHKKAPQYALAGTLLLAWNPIVLFETWGNGHNDMAMVFWVLAAALALLNRRYTLAILALVAGALIKFIPVLLILPALALAIQDRQTAHHRFKFLATTLILSLLLVVISYVPFWDGVKVLNIQERTQLYTSSLPASIFNLLLGQHWPKDKAAEIISKTALGITLLFVLLKSRRVWKKPTFYETTEAITQILLFYLLVTCLWFQNWYSLWPAGLAPLLKPGPTRRMALLAGFATLSKPMGIGPFLFWPRPRMAQPWLEIWFTLGVLGLPWLYWLFSIWRSNYALSIF
jgi:alpha-1,6-mannosyltransferase